MSNHSEQTYLVTKGDAINCAAPATPTLKADHHRQDDTRCFSMADVRACGGDHHAAILLGQLRYWWPRKYACHRGVKKSLADWKAELALSRYEVERSAKILVKCGLVETYQDAWGHFKSPSTFYVLTEKALSIKPLANPSQVVRKALANLSQVTENTTSFTEKEKTKPVDASQAKPSTPSPEIPMQPGKDKSKTKPSLTAVGKTPKFLSWGKTFDDAVTACHGAPKVVLPEDQQKIRHRNLKLMCRRMLDAQYTPEQVHAFLRWAGGEGWMTLRTEWGPVYHPDIHAKEQVPFTPDLRWLVGSPTHGTGAHRLEAALGVWGFFGGPTPNAHAHPQPVVTPEPQEPPATPLADLDVNNHMPEAVQPAVELAVIDTRLSIAAAWELIERSSALICQIEIWRGRIAAGVPTPALEQYLEKHPCFTMERLEIALALMPEQAPQQPATAPVDADEYSEGRTLQDGYDQMAQQARGC